MPIKPPRTHTTIWSQKHRLIVGIGSCASLVMVTAFALTPSSDATQIEQQAITEELPLAHIERIPTENPRYLREERILRTDSLGSLALRLGIHNAKTLALLANHKDTQIISQQLRPGKAVSAVTDGNGDLLKLVFPLNGKDSSLVINNENGEFNVKEQTLTPERHIAVSSGEIRHSLFGATDAAGIPDAVAVQLAEIFSADIDFYRDLRKGDRFSIVYETLLFQGQAIRSGKILGAEFVNNRKTYTAHWFQPENSKGGYYSSDGKNLRKAFLRSPLEFSRVTSGFTSSRLHPVLQITRAHKGIDYGAPVGTKVRSVADGTVEFAGWQGGYGKMIVIKHQGAFSTAYGHLNAFAPGIKKGSKISQNDTIGFTGQTGLASGPHLHYEFRVNSVQVNPMTAALPAAIPLEATQLAKFREAIPPLREHLALAKQINFAALE